MKHDNLFFVGAQMNNLYRFFAALEDQEALHVEAGTGVLLTHQRPLYCTHQHWITIGKFMPIFLQHNR